MKKRFFLIIICTLVFFTGISFCLFLNKRFLFSSNLEKSVEKYWNTKVEIKDIRDFNIYGQNFKIILSTKPDDKKYKYLNVYEEKFNGLYYELSGASEQGFSKSYIDFKYMSDRTDSFTVIYGYNKDLKVKSCEVEVSMYDTLYTLKLDLPKKEYFIDVFNGNYRGIINAYGENNNEELEYFVD